MEPRRIEWEHQPFSQFPTPYRHNAFIFSVELITLAMPVRRITKLPIDRNYTIFDYGSTLLALLDRSRNSLVLALQKFSSVKMSGGIAFCWVPSRVGVQGNKLTDAEAKSATISKMINECYLPLDILLRHLPAINFYTR